MQDLSLLQLLCVCVSVKYSAWGSEVEMTYGGFWDARSDVDGEHSITVGTSADPASDSQLFGQVAQLMVGNRSVLLTAAYGMVALLA